MKSIYMFAFMLTISLNSHEDLHSFENSSLEENTGLQRNSIHATSRVPENSNTNHDLGREFSFSSPDIAITSTTLRLIDQWGNSYNPDWTEACVVSTVSGIGTAKDAIYGAFEMNNKPVAVAIDAHGSPGTFTIGLDTVSISNVDQFISGLRGKISSLNLMSCETAKGEQGKRFIRHLEQALGADVIASTGINWDIPPTEQNGTGNHWYTDGDRISWESGSQSMQNISFAN